MVIEISRIFQAENSCALVRCCGDCIVTTTKGTSDNLCAVQLYSASRPDSERPPLLIAEWQIPGGTDLGNIVAVDAVNRVVYAAHEASCNVSVLSCSKARSGRSGARRAVAVPFQNKILSIIRFDAGEGAIGGDSMVVVSETAEIAVLQSSANPSVTSVQKTSLSFSNPVAAVSKYGKNALVLTCLVESYVEVHVVQFDSSSGFRAVEKPAIRLPSIPKRSPKVFVLGCTIQPQSIFVLYSDGTLHAFHPKNYNAAIHSSTLNAWWSASQSVADELDPTLILTPPSTFKLSPSPPRESGRIVRSDMAAEGTGALCSLGDNYAVVAYGNYCSIWDSAYHSDHGYTELQLPVSRVLSCSEAGNVRLEADGVVYSMEIISILDKGLTLAEALKRKGSCDAILSGPGKNSLLTAQPVTVNLLKTVADAGGDFSRVYQQHIRTDDTDDAKRIKRIFMRGKTPSAEDLSTATRQYVREFGKLRRGNHGKPSDLGLAKLPSQQIAAATCARCLWEIFEGKVEFVVPFIDMVGTGVVSSEYVLNTLRAWDMQLNYKTAKITSMAAVLARSPKTLYALEAVVAAISDLSESDIVRAAQMATRMRFVYERERSELGKAETVKKNDETTGELARRRATNEDLGRKAHRLLLRCIVARVDRLKLISALRKMPQHDVRNMLSYFQDILDKFSTRKSDPFFERNEASAKKRGKETVKFKTEDQCIAYRGVEHWLDVQETSSVKILDPESQELQGCIEWASLVLDAHLASLVLDEEGQMTVKALLRSVAFQRRQCEMLAPILGALEHIQAEIPLPKHKPLYFVSQQEVPLFAALQ